MANKCEFNVRADKVKFVTQTNGDSIYIKGLHMSQQEATDLAWLVNLPPRTLLNIKIKEK